ncbi:MAG: YdcH family protein [Candidatus Lambdaproteobacteria bacterium]|nr:YdcH family protein [Candidatus Lambdaproteobacteria bacterium]
MDEQTLKMIDSVRATHPQIGLLLDQHRDLDRHVSELSARAHLTPEEEIELARLKKEKLHVRDLIETMLPHQQAS